MTGLLCQIGEAQPFRISADTSLTIEKGTRVRFNLTSGGCWYGHGFSHRQPYPLNAEPVINSRFAVNNIQSPIWLASAGFAIIAQTVQVLDVRLNEKGNGWLEIHCDEAPITIQIFAGAELPEAHRKLMRSLHWPSPAPEPSIFGDSIFCTWTQYPRAITQQRILDMARSIREHKFPCSVLTIDDRWESVFGELEFSRDFPNPKAMVDQLHAMGFRVLLWVTPFINQEAATYSFLAEKGWLAPYKESPEPSLLRWWGGTAGLVDLTNPQARDWYREQLLRLKNDVGVDGFKIDGGDAKYHPDPAVTRWYSDAGASGYVDLLLETFESVAPGMCESRTGWLSQKRNILWREGGKDSQWGVDNGLKAMVHLALHLGLLGYDLLIPDMVPGRIQTLVSEMPLPSDELFVRWTEASALMPILQFSYYPWNYAAGTAEIAHGFAEFHKALESYLHRSSDARQTPLLRPLWYDEPRREELYSMGDEFLLGPDLLVAPVLLENQVARDIVLPSGAWRDLWTGEVYRQERILQHPAPCPGIPLFLREGKQDALFNMLHGILAKIPSGTVRTNETTATYSCGLDRDLNVTG
jgi:myogenesis-regulating glycosidase